MGRGATEPEVCFTRRRLGPARGLAPSGCSNAIGWFGLCMLALSRGSVAAVQKLLFMCDLITPIYVQVSKQDGTWSENPGMSPQISIH